MKMNRNQLLILVLVTGFLFGYIYVMKTIPQGYVFDELTLSYLKNFKIRYKDYFFFLLRERMGMLIIMIFLGQVKYTQIYGGIVTLFVGICGGTVFARAWIQMRVKGVILGILGMSPQILFYALAYGILISFWMGKGRWTWVKTVGLILLMSLGIICETYISPFLFKLFL